MKAFKKGIHSFNITARGFEGEDYNCQGLIVAVFLSSNLDAEGCYGAFHFYSDVDPVDNFRAMNNLKAFIGEE